MTTLLSTRDLSERLIDLDMFLSLDIEDNSIEVHNMDGVILAAVYPDENYSGTLVTIQHGPPHDRQSLLDLLMRYLHTPLESRHPEVVDTDAYITPRSSSTRYTLPSDGKGKSMNTPIRVIADHCILVMSKSESMQVKLLKTTR